MYDMSSLPEESSAANSMVDDVVRAAGHDSGRGQIENVCRTLLFIPGHFLKKYVFNIIMFYILIV